jgi:hypothetical protein
VISPSQAWILSSDGQYMLGEHVEALWTSTIIASFLSFETVSKAAEVSKLLVSVLSLSSLSNQVPVLRIDMRRMLAF